VVQLLHCAKEAPAVLPHGPTVIATVLQKMAVKSLALITGVYQEEFPRWK
jgi:hypothetical protein